MVQFLKLSAKQHMEKLENLYIKDAERGFHLGSAKSVQEIIDLPETLENFKIPTSEEYAAMQQARMAKSEANQAVLMGQTQQSWKGVK